MASFITAELIAWLEWSVLTANGPLVNVRVAKYFFYLSQKFSVDFRHRDRSALFLSACFPNVFHIYSCEAMCYSTNFVFLQPKSEILLRLLWPLKATIFAAWNWKYKMVCNMLHVYSLLITCVLTFE